MNPEILLGHQLLGFLGLLPAPCCWHPNFQWDFTMEGPGFGPGDNGPMYAFYPNSGYSWLRGGKGQVLEGGVRTPSMAWWPGMILANQEPVDLLHITVPWRLFGTWKSWGNSWNTWGFEPKNREKHQMCLIVFRISRHISHSCSTFFFLQMFTSLCHSSHDFFPHVHIFFCKCHSILPTVFSTSSHFTHHVFVKDLYTTAARLGGALDAIPEDRVVDGVDQLPLLLLGEGHGRRKKIFFYSALAGRCGEDFFYVFFWTITINDGD